MKILLLLIIFIALCAYWWQCRQIKSPYLESASANANNIDYYIANNITLSTSKPNSVVMLRIQIENKDGRAPEIDTITDNENLNFTHITDRSVQLPYGTLEIFFAKSPKKLINDIITVIFKEPVKSKIEAYGIYMEKDF